MTIVYSHQFQRSRHFVVSFLCGQIVQKQREFYVFVGGEHRNKIVKLKMYPNVFGSPVSKPERDSVAISVPAYNKRTGSGESIPAIKFRSVVLPLPEGPINAVNVPSWMSRSRRSSGVMVVEPFVYVRVRSRTFNICHNESPNFFKDGGYSATTLTLFPCFRSATDW